MRKWILILVFLLTIQPGYKIISVLAEETKSTSVSPVIQGKDSIEIKKVIETYLQCVAGQDLDCAMSHVSKESVTEIQFYNGLKLALEGLFKNTAHTSISNLNVIALDVADNKATIFVEFRVTRFDLNTVRNSENMRRVQYSLIKEGDAWKIVRIGPRG